MRPLELGFAERACEWRLHRARARANRARGFSGLVNNGSIEFTEQLVDLDPLLFNVRCGQRLLDCLPRNSRM